MSILQIIMLGIIGAIASLIIKQTHPEIAMIIGLATGIIILYFTFAKAVVIVETINQIAKTYNVQTEYIELIIKIIGITYISEFAISSLQDAGESGIAAKVEIFSKLVVVSMAVPVFMTLVQTVTSMLM